jgi:hypothetical protein
VDDPTRSEPLAELREFLLGRVVILLGLLFGIEMVEVAEELIEAVIGGEKLIPIAEVVFAELPRLRSPRA